MSTAPAASPWKLLRTALLVCAGSFLFAFFLLPPLYYVACEKIFGIKLQATADGGQRVAGAVVDPDRVVRVEFDGTVNSKLQWTFRPLQMTMDVRPGELYEANYVAKNVSDHPIVASAVPSVAPSEASTHFAKTECFCFTEQTLQPGEERVMPVRFIIDPSLPAGVRTVTLSYTFYNNDSATAGLAAQAAGALHAAP